MRAWVDETVTRILALSPKRVLEIGCGTGLLLFRIAKACERYTGVDFAREALASIEGKLPKSGLTNVALREMTAEGVGALDETFDTIVLNSVAQYFDGADGLVKVIEAGYSRLAPGGAFFLGDLRSLPLLDAFHASLELFRAPDATPLSDLRARIDRRAKGERELVLDPAMFTALGRVLPDLAGVSIRLKADAHDNELTRFRYDVVLRKAGPGVEVGAVPPDLAAPEECSDAALRALLARAGDAVRITGVPDARTREHVAAATLLAQGDAGGTVADLRAKVRAGAFAIDPSRVLALDPAWVFEAAPAARAGAFDLVARRASSPVPIAAFVPTKTDARPWSAFANAPSRAAAQGALGPELRNHLRELLPDFMIPSAFVSLDAYPLTPNGKVDRKALPAPDRARREAATEYTAPTNDLEQVIATVWQDMLSIDRVGADQNFFDLGANSLMMVQVNGRLRSALGRSVSLVDMFRFPTVRALAAHLGDGAKPADEALVNESADRAQTRRDAMARRRDARQAQRVKG
jgi:SAM-dependent methyltransferase/acyl carrier protein